MTYKALAEEISKLSPEQKEMDVTVSCDLSQEAIPVKDLYVIKGEDFMVGVLDDNHPVLTIDF